MTTKALRCWAEIDAKALAHNVHALGTLGPPVMAVLKANAYGHGASLIAKPLLGSGIRHFGIATVPEGEALRQEIGKAHAADAAIYLLTQALPDEATQVLSAGLIPFVSDFSFAQALSNTAQAARKDAQIHIEVDTGIGRAGVLPANLPAFFQACSKLANLSVSGLCTHFTTADEDSRDAARQYTLFEKAVASLPPQQVSQMTLHAANSPATLRLPAARLHLTRPGLLLYGIAPSSRFLIDPQIAFPYRPVLSLKARALLVRRLPAGSEISYGRTYRLSKAATIATIGIGYGDGFPRRLSNIGEALLPMGERAPIRGRVCMDQLCIEVPEGATLSIGDAVTLIGAVGGERITVNQIADQIDTTPHEITTCLTARVPRVLVDG